MMKRLLMLLALIALLVPCAALADMAEDITTQCSFNNRAYNETYPDNVCDRNFGTYYTDRGLVITAPQGKLIGSVEIKFRTIDMPGVILQTKIDGEWVEIMRDGPRYMVQYIRLPVGVSTLRIAAQKGKLELCEVTVLTPGDPPDYVQVWRDAPEDVDLMLFSTHPDDEVLWFGGLLPYYAGERDMDVLVVNAVPAQYFRRHELLASLWTCGVDIYPEMLGYLNLQKRVEEIIDEWTGRIMVPRRDITALIRRYQPEVVVLHDINGEYGHTAHMAFSQLGRECVVAAADPAEYPESAEQWGVWDVPKTYIHLYSENRIQMDWQQPLEAFGGKTGFEVATEAFEWHKSQHTRWSMEKSFEYDNSLFGLWRTTVGLDVEKNDMFENIPVQ